MMTEITVAASKSSKSKSICTAFCSLRFAEPDRASKFFLAIIVPLVPVGMLLAEPLKHENRVAWSAPLIRLKYVSSLKIKRKYVWTKSGGLCWYCGAQLYCPGEADTEYKKQFVFTTDHVHPRSNGGRGRANKVPACKYCNSHKSSRSVEEFRQWLQTLVCEQATHARALGGEYGPRRWKINSEAVVFYFELARPLNGGLENPVSGVRRISSEAHANLFHVRE